MALPSRSAELQSTMGGIRRCCTLSARSLCRLLLPAACRTLRLVGQLPDSVLLNVIKAMVRIRWRRTRQDRDARQRP